MMKKLALFTLGLCLVWASGAQANLFKDGWLDHGSNNIDLEHADVGWNVKNSWTTNASGVVNLGPASNAGASVGQVFSVNSGSDTGNVLILSFDWTPAAAPNTATQLDYQLIGWNEVSAAVDGNFFQQINWGGNKVGTLNGTHERVDLINGGAGSTVNSVGMTENQVTTAAGTTTNYSITVDLVNLVAGVSDFSDYEYVGVRFGINAANSNSTDCAIENISLTLSNAPVVEVPAVTGTFIDTEFSAGDGYGNGDLHGQESWEAMAAFAASGESFTVDTTSGGSAAATSQIGNAHTNGIFWSEVTSNQVNDSWSGTMVFTLNAVPADGLYKTNTYLDVDGITEITNVQQVAKSIRNRNAFTFGITSTTSNILAGAADPVIQVKQDWGNDIDIGFCVWNDDANTMLSLSKNDLGWDPAWQSQPASNGPIFETLPITLDYTIRKTSIENGYSATVTATIDGETHVGSWEFTADESHTWKQPVDVYGESFVNFAMGVSLPTDDEVVYPSISSLSVTHTGDSSIPLTVPANLNLTNGDLSLDLAWTGSGEQDSFTIYRSETQGGPYSNLATVVDTDLNGEYTDSPLTDKRSYFYVVTANYPGGESVYSDEANRRALQYYEHIRFGDYTPWFNGNKTMALTDVATNGAATIKFWESNGTNNSTIALADVGTVNLAQMLSWPRLVLQTPVGSADPEKMENRTQDVLDMKPSNGSALLVWSEGSSFDASAAAMGVETLKLTGGSNSRIAIRAGNQWYASEMKVGSGIVNVPDLRTENWSTFDIATVDSTALMEAAGPFVAGSTLNLTLVNAVGILTENKSQNFWFEGYKSTYGTELTAYDVWADASGIYNADAESSVDFDADGLDNISEWGLGGDPADPADVGISERYISIDDSTGNFIYVHPVLKGARPNYTVMETGNLPIIPFWDNSATYIITEGGDWPSDADFNTMTNEVSASDAVKFLQLIIE